MILFSHHQHLVEQARALEAGIQIMALGNDPLWLQSRLFCVQLLMLFDRNLAYITVMREAKWIWQQPDWPVFRYDSDRFSRACGEFASAASRLAGRIEALAEQPRQQITVDLMVTEAIKTMEIEGERLDRESVVNSIAAMMGFLPGKGLSSDQKAEGVARLMTDVRQHWDQPLTRNLLCAWQAAVLSDSGFFRLGDYRDDGMQVVSGAVGRYKVHYEAPPPDRVEAEMDRFIHWYNDSRGELPGPLRAGVAHLWFESIHPFEDGNGRVGRAIADQALSQDLGFPTLGCLATAIERNKKAYYRELSAAQRNDAHIQSWLGFFTQMTVEAQRIALKQVDFILDKARFHDRFGDHLNDRQAKVLDAVFRGGPDRVARGITRKDYLKIAKCSDSTAGRDIAGLVRTGAIAKVPGTATRNVRYLLAMSSIGHRADRDGPAGLARPLFRSSGADGQLFNANPAIRYDGPVVAVDDRHVIQRIASRTFVAHPLDSLSDRPQVGAVVSIRHGHVTAPAHRDERGINR